MLSCFHRASILLTAATFAIAALVPSAHAALVGRDINGLIVSTTAPTCVFIYDTDQNVTWLRDWSYATTSGFTAAADGRLVWGTISDTAATQSANGYMDYLNALNSGAGYGGFTGWRLPSADLSVPAAGAFNATGGEIGHLWYVELGNIANPGTSSAGPFLNMNTNNINLASWTRDVYAANTTQAWNFRTSQGYQFHDSRGNTFQTPAVRTGDVASVGACCNRLNGTCLVEAPAICAAHGLRFDGLGSTCSASSCRACAADFDANGTIAVPDIFAFLSAWFAGCP